MKNRKFDTPDMENEKRTPAIEHGDPKDSPYAGCVDCYDVFYRMLCQMGNRSRTLYRSQHIHKTAGLQYHERWQMLR